MKKKSSIINVFDICVIAVAALLAGVLFLLGGGETQSAGDGEENLSSTVTYTVELTGMMNNSAELVSVGDELVDRVKKYDVGTVTDVTVQNTVRQVSNLIEGGSAPAEMERLQTAIITIEAPCTQNDREITVGGGYTVRVGTAVSLKGPGYYGTGYIVGIER